jgi:hypothetical protein
MPGFNREPIDASQRLCVLLSVFAQGAESRKHFVKLNTVNTWREVAIKVKIRESRTKTVSSSIHKHELIHIKQQAAGVCYAVLAGIFR